MQSANIEDVIEVRGRNSDHDIYRDDGESVSDLSNDVSNHKMKEYGRMVLATILHGIGTGVIGLFIALLIRTVQVIGFGVAEKDAGFLTIAVNSPPWRRFVSVSCGGIFGAVAWYWLRGVDPAFVSVDASIKGERMPPLITLINGMIQDICVALGGSFGREAAPREIAAMWGGLIADKLHVTADQRRILVACGTGAGLAAVYQVPISGVLYTVEHVLKWEMSWAVWIPATVTVILATIVANPLVPDDGLYAMELYSYRWPSWRMFTWAIVIGPISGCSAVAFRRLIKYVETIKPLARLPAEWNNLHHGQWVRLKVHEVGDGCQDASRASATVLSKEPQTVRVRFHDTGEDVDYGKDSWDALKPEGRRDWRILIAMPSAFLVLAILSPVFPSLLGNGRALAKVAIHRKRKSQLWIPLLVLKVVCTVAAIGAGAAGGTLTPSVAMGSTIGIIIWEGWTQAEHLTTTTTTAAAFDHIIATSTNQSSAVNVIEGLEEVLMAPHEYQAAAAISAAAFLAIGISSPVTGFALLMEFSAQAVHREDLIAALEGNPARLWHSKFAIGMMVPMATAVAMAQLTNMAMTALCARMKDLLQPTHSPRSTKLQERRKSRKSCNLDFPDSQEYDEACHLDEHTQNACFACFRAALIINTCLTVAAAAAVPTHHNIVFRVSLLGIPLALVIGLGMWICFCCRSRPSRTVGTDDLALTAGSDTESLTEEETNRQSCRHIAFGTLLIILCTLIGAAVPMCPWAMQGAQREVWETESVDWVVLLATALASIAASACGAALHTVNAELPSEAGVGYYALITALAAGAAGAIGVVYGTFGKPVEHWGMLAHTLHLDGNMHSS